MEENSHMQHRLPIANGVLSNLAMRCDILLRRPHIACPTGSEWSESKISLILSSQQRTKDYDIQLFQQLF